MLAARFRNGEVISLRFSVADTSLRFQRRTVSQYERGAAQESRTSGDLVDGAGE